MERPLRVCIATAYDLADEGGVKRHAQHLVGELRRRGDEVLLVGPYSGAAPLPAGTAGLGGSCRVRSNGSNCRPGLFVSPWRMRRLLERRFDVVHVMEPVVPLLGWYAAWFAGGAARVATFHSYSENERPASRWIRRWLGRAQLSCFDRAIAVSAPAARFARALWPRPLALIPNGVDTGVFAPPPVEIAPPDRALRLLFVGQWHNPRKGLPALLAAFARLRAAGVRVTLEVVGDGEAGARPNVPGVTFVGPIAGERALAARYRAADLFVAPSLGQESFGIVLLEAMACGRPMVCSDIAGYRALAPPDGTRLVPPGDAPALAAAVAELAAHSIRRRRMAAANRAAALAYDWSAIAARVRDEYLEALGRREAGRSFRSTTVSKSPTA